MITKVCRKRYKSPLYSHSSLLDVQLVSSQERRTGAGFIKKLNNSTLYLQFCDEMVHSSQFFQYVVVSPSQDRKSLGVEHKKFRLTRIKGCRLN
jgi:hypothetical protein